MASVNTIIQLFEILVVGAAAALILLAAWQDFTTWKIRNWTVLTLVALYAALALLRAASMTEFPGVGGTTFYGDIAAGLLLFVLGFILWALRMLGAGDAKLFFAVGLFVGMNLLLPFGLALAVGGVVAAIVLKFPVALHWQHWPPVARLMEIRKTGKVPYGVLIAAAALFAMYLRYVPASS